MKANPDYSKKRSLYERLLKGTVLGFSSIGVLIFVVILGYVFITGSKLIGFDLLFGDYNVKNYNVYSEVDSSGPYTTDYELSEGEYYSETWDIVLKDDQDYEGNAVVFLTYVGENSPLNEAYFQDAAGEQTPFETENGLKVLTIIVDDYVYSAFARYGAEKMVDIIDSGTVLTTMSLQTMGGGIWGSIKTTLWLIVLTLIIAVPLGVSTAIYINEYAVKNKVTEWMVSMIEMLTGVPSIIYGLMGAALFIPLANNMFGTSGGSIISGALTMSVILLPVIIKNTQESLKVIPQDVRAASLALGASQTQTVTKIVIPSAIPGILTGVLLGIGRIMGESAALVYAIGAVIKDDIVITERSTTLAVHIWSIMAGESPNFQLACAISIVILFVVLTLNLLTKLVANKLSKSWY